ncbi:transcriptional regulator, TetR family [Bradyrhizobium erythrophlei]|nr:transcriptional regulator, TetR family [Bradyrhizobium erythrophlei]
MARPREFDYDDVVRKATHLFWRRGYQNTSIDDIETATGLTKGSLYKAFDNKRDLFKKCLDHYMVRDSYKAIFLRMVDRPLIETYAHLLDLLIESVNNDAKRPCGCLATNVIRELSASDSVLATEASEGLAGMQQAMEFRLSWARDKGEFNQDIDVKALASLMMVTLQGMVVLSTSTKDAASMRRARDMVVGMLENSRPKRHQ